MENKHIFKWFLLLIAIFEYCVVCSYQRNDLILLLFFIIGWIIKDLYISFSEINESDIINNYGSVYGGYDYYSHYDHNNTKWQNTNATFTSYYETVNKKVLANLKPNMNIILDSQEKTKTMNDKKNKYLEKMRKVEVVETKVENKPQLLLPPPKQQTIEPSIIIITNTEEINTVRKNVYNSIISYLNKTLKVDCEITKILNYIEYIDVVEETRSVFIYIKEIKKFNEVINSYDLINFIKKDSDMSGVVSIDEYKSLTILEYFSSCKKK